MTSIRSRIRSDDRGVAESAVAIVGVLMLVMLVLSAALFWYGQVVVTRAAHQGLEQTRLLNGSPGSGEALASQFVDQTGVVTNPQISASRSPTQATVTVEGEALSMIPGVTLTVSATASGPVERLEP